MPIPFIHPSTILIAGPSTCGKTCFLIEALCQNMLEPKPDRVVLVYGEAQRAYDRLTEKFPFIELIKGPLTGEVYDSFKASENNLLILDDQMLEAANSADLGRLFVQGSHHKNITVVFLVQNVFEKGKSMKTTNLNSQYLVIFKNPRDKGQSAILARQMFPTKWKGFLAAMEDAHSKPYSYLVVDLRPETPDEIRIRSSMLPTDSDAPTKVYII